MAVNDSTPEEWRSVVGWEGYYSVSSHGRVRSEDRVVVTSHGVTRMLRGRIRRFCANHHGYLMCGLIRGDDSTRRSRPVHTMVAEAFIGPRPTMGTQIDHINCDKLDNRPENLRYVSSEEHHAITIAAGLLKKGEEASGAKLSSAAVLRIRNSFRELRDALCSEYGVSKTTLHAILMRQKWTHV